MRVTRLSVWLPPKLVTTSVPRSARAADTGDARFELGDLRVEIGQRLPFVLTLHAGWRGLVAHHQDPGHTLAPPNGKTGRGRPPCCVQPVTLAAGVEAIGEPDRCRVGMQHRGQLGFITIEENASE